MARLSVQEAVDQIEAGMSALSALMADPSLVSFDEVAGEFERLEQALVARGRVDAAFAWLAESADAGRLVGSTNVIDYLTAQLGISRKEAWSRLRTGTSLFSPPPPPPPPPPAAVASVSVGPDTTTLVAQQTRQLSATPRDSAGNALTRAVSWSSSTPGVASVSGTGLVTAHGPGSASITATSEGRVGTATVTVRDGLFVGPTGGTLSVGGASVIVPAGAVTTGTAFTVASVAGPPAHPRLVAGTAWLLGPEGSAFAEQTGFTGLVLKFSTSLPDREEFRQ